MNMPFGHHEQRLLDEFQRDFPLVSRPFGVIGAALGISEDEVLKKLAALKEAGTITRVGATIRPNTAGASTLAALAVPEDRIDEIAAIVGSEDGVNHSYLREDDWNLWFVVTAPDLDSLEASLGRIKARTGLDLLDLRLVRPFNIDLGFRLKGPREALATDRPADMSVLLDGDRPILQALTSGLPLVPRPFADLSAQLGLAEAAVIDRVKCLAEARILTRVGVIVRHRAVGWSANAMVVWQVPQERLEQAGNLLSRHPGVTLCYQRRTIPGVWPFNLYSMIHARSRSEALGILEDAASLPGISGLSNRVLFSSRCFKQTGALLSR